MPDSPIYVLVALNDNEGVAHAADKLNEYAARGYRVVPVTLKSGLLLLERQCSGLMSE